MYMYVCISLCTQFLVSPPSGGIHTYIIPSVRVGNTCTSRGPSVDERTLLRIEPERLFLSADNGASAHECGWSVALSYGLQCWLGHCRVCTGSVRWCLRGGLVGGGGCTGNSREIWYSGSPNWKKLIQISFKKYILWFLCASFCFNYNTCTLYWVNVCIMALYIFIGGLGYMLFLFKLMAMTSNVMRRWVQECNFGIGNCFEKTNSARTTIHIAKYVVTTQMSLKQNTERKDTYYFFAYFCNIVPFGW